MYYCRAIKVEIGHLNGFMFFVYKHPDNKHCYYVRSEAIFIIKINIMYNVNVILQIISEDVKTKIRILKIKMFIL